MPVCDASPETGGVHASPTAASEPHKGNPQHGNTQHLWLHVAAPSWKQIKTQGREEITEGLYDNRHTVSCVNIELSPLNKQR